MDFITAPLIVGIITLGIYKLFELFACRRERITLIEKLGEKMSQTDLELNGKICLPDFNRPQLSFGALKGGCLLLGVGLGLLVGFILSYVSFSPYDLDRLDRGYTREMVGVIYGSCTLLFGGAGLVASFLIEQNFAAKKKEAIAMATASSFLDFGDSLFTMFFNQFVYIGVSKLFCLGKACASRFLLL